MNLILREPFLADIISLAALCEELGYPTSAEEMSLRMSRISEQENCKTIVAEVDDKIVGFMGMSINSSWEQNESYLRIQALVVSAKYRKLKIGKQLICFAENWAKENNMKAINLNCGNRPERENAHKFYTTMGFEAKSTGYRKIID